MKRAGKRLELLVRRSFIRILGRPKRVSRAPEAIDLPERPRILLLRHDRIGDAIVSTPIFALLRKRYPSARIEILLGRRNRATASLLPDIDEAIILPGSLTGFFKTVGLLRRRRYDLVINLLAKDSASGGMLAALAGARSRIGFEGELGALYDAAVPHPATPEHIVSETSRLLAPLGIPRIGPAPATMAEHLAIRITSDAASQAERLLAELNPIGASPRIAINISTPSESRRWDAGKTAELARRLSHAGVTTMIAATPGDGPAAHAIAAEAGVGVIPTTESFPAFAALLSKMDLIVTPDTSIVHLAAALGKPTVVLNTAEDAAAAWTPWGVPYRLLCGHGTVSTITVNEVESGLRSLIDEIAASSQPSTRV